MFSLLKGLLEFLSPLEKENHSLILSVLVCSMIQYSKSLIKKNPIRQCTDKIWSLCLKLCTKIILYYICMTCMILNCLLVYYIRQLFSAAVIIVRFFLMHIAFGAPVYVA